MAKDTEQKFDLKQAVDEVRGFQLGLVNFSAMQDVNCKIRIIHELSDKMKTLSDSLSLITEEDLKPRRKSHEADQFVPKNRRTNTKLSFQV